MTKKKNPYNNWLKTGLLFGTWMFLTMSVAYPLLMKKGFNYEDALLALPAWILVGFAWALFMRWVSNRRKE